MQASPFIAVSLLLMLGIGVLVFAFAGKDSKSSNWDDPKPKDPRHDPPE